MSFPGISSTRAGAEPGRSGFPASYTSLLTYPLGCPAEGGFSGPLSERCCHTTLRPFREDGAGYPKGCPSDSIAPSAAAWKADTRRACRGFSRTPLTRPNGIPTPPRRSSARPALDLPTGFAFSPWVSASITCPGVRTSSPAPGAFANGRLA